MPRIISTIGRFVVDPEEITGDNSGTYIYRLAEHVNSLVSALTTSPEDNIAPGSVDSESIIQNSIDKKHVLATNSSNLLDNPSFELVGIGSSYEVISGGGIWDRVLSADESPAVTAYQGKYVARYNATGQDVLASIYGSGDMGIISEYNPGVIQAQAGEVYSFSFQALYYSGGESSPDDRDLVTGVIEFRNSSGGVISTHSSTEILPGTPDTWTAFTVPNKVAPAATAYIVAGIKVAAPSDEDEGVIYYFDGTVLQRDIGIPDSYYSANQEISYGVFEPTALNRFPTTLTYYDLPDLGATGGYSNEVAQDFAEDASTGNIVYTGERTGKFLVQYGASLRCLSVLAHYSIYLRIMKTGTVVDGSDIRDNYYGDKLSGYAWVRDPRLSGSVVVELDTDNTISVEIGIDATSEAYGPDSFGTGADGVSLCITGVSN